MTEITKHQAAVPALPTNPFAVAQRDHVNAGTVEIEQSRAIAEAQGKLLIAKRFPRDQAAAFEQVMQSCSRRGMAESAMYAYPRGGQTVTGPSIRLAEELARAWGNMDFGIRELSQRAGESEMEAYCWDLQTNVHSSKKFTVKHERHTRQGVTRLTDPRDIYELTANQSGRRLRASILAVIPPDLVESAIAKCRQTLAGDTSEPLVDRVRKMLSAFSPYGVTKEHIEEKIGKKLDKILVDEFVELTSIFRSIKDGVYKPSEYFSVGVAQTAEEGSAIAELNKKVSEKKTTKVNKAQAEAISEPAPQPAPEPVEAAPVMQADDEDLL